MLDDLLQHALEGLQAKAQLDTGSIPRKAPKQTAMKVNHPISASHDSTLTCNLLCLCVACKAVQ